MFLKICQISGSCQRSRDTQGLRIVPNTSDQAILIRIYPDITIGAVIAIFLAQILLPSFNNLAGVELHIPYTSLVFWSIVVIGGISIGLIAGVYPAFFLSSFRPIAILSGTVSKGSNSGLIRNILVIFQFSISIILIIGTIA
ncbi:MAG: hypothetical protein PVH48_04555, partial [Cyclobacteriaceae bacterium]